MIKNHCPLLLRLEPGFTLYVNPYLTVSHDGRYTKHIFAGEDRVVSKIGNPLDYIPGDPTGIGVDAAPVIEIIHIKL